MNIFIVLFILLFGTMGQLQTNQSVTSTKNDTSVVVSAVTSYQANNKGQFPSATEVETGSFASKYLSDVGLHGEYKYRTSGADDTGIMLLHFGTKCDGSTGPRLFSVSTLADDGQRFCLDN